MIHLQHILIYITIGLFIAVNVPRMPGANYESSREITISELRATYDAIFKRGICEGEAPPGIHDVAIRNVWQGKVGNKYVRIYAGASYVAEDDSWESVLVYETRNELMDIEGFEWFKPVRSVGPLTVVAEASIDVLTVTDSRNNHLRFDIREKLFI